MDQDSKKSIFFLQLPYVHAAEFQRLCIPKGGSQPTSCFCPDLLLQTVAHLPTAPAAGAVKTEPSGKDLGLFFSAAFKPQVPKQPLHQVIFISCTPVSDSLNLFIIQLENCCSIQMSLWLIPHGSRFIISDRDTSFPQFSVNYTIVYRVYSLYY